MVYLIYARIMRIIIICANNGKDAFSALVLFCLYVEKYEVKHCKTLVFYSFACQCCNDSFVFSYLEVTTTVYIYSLTHIMICVYI